MTLALSSLCGGERGPVPSRILERVKAMDRKKVFTQLIDIHTREVVGEGELTPAATKRLIKLYQGAGYWVEVA